MSDIKLRRVVNDLISQLESIPNGCDLSDIGNIIGIVIGDHTIENGDGFEKSDFIHGLHHGFSLVDGTHNKNN